MYYVNERWLGGMLTNFKTIQSRIARLKEIETMAMMEHSMYFRRKKLSHSRKSGKVREEPWRNQRDEEILDAYLRRRS